MMDIEQLEIVLAMIEKAGDGAFSIAVVYFLLNFIKVIALFGMALYLITKFSTMFTSTNETYKALNKVRTAVLDERYAHGNFTPPELRVINKFIDKAIEDLEKRKTP